MKKGVTHLTDEHRDTLKEVLDKNCGYVKIRPYYIAVDYEDDYIVLVPYHSNIPKNYSISIKNGKKRRKLKPGEKEKMYGLNFLKIVIIKKENWENQTIKGNAIDSIIMEDTLTKQAQIVEMINKIMMDYSIAAHKKIDGDPFISNQEKILLDRCTLINYHAILGLDN